MTHFHLFTHKGYIGTFAVLNNRIFWDNIIPTNIYCDASTYTTQNFRDSVRELVVDFLYYPENTFHYTQGC